MLSACLRHKDLHKNGVLCFQPRSWQVAVDLQRLEYFPDARTVNYLGGSKLVEELEAMPDGDAEILGQRGTGTMTAPLVSNSLIRC